MKNATVYTIYDRKTELPLLVDGDIEQCLLCTGYHDANSFYAKVKCGGTQKYIISKRTIKVPNAKKLSPRKRKRVQKPDLHRDVNRALKQHISYGQYKLNQMMEDMKDE